MRTLFESICVGSPHMTRFAPPASYSAIGNSKSMSVKNASESVHRPQDDAEAGASAPQPGGGAGRTQARIAEVVAGGRAYPEEPRGVPARGGVVEEEVEQGHFVPHDLGEKITPRRPHRRSLTHAVGCHHVAAAREVAEEKALGRNIQCRGYPGCLGRVRTGYFGSTCSAFQRRR